MKLTNYLVRMSPECNFNCLFCFWTKKNRRTITYSPRDYFRQIDSVPVKREHKIVFAGGEPTLSKELPMLISYARERGIRNVEIQTNALRCYYEDYIKELKDRGLTSVLIGLHSHDHKAFDLLTGTSGYFAKVLKGAENIFSCGIEVRFNHAITTLTFRKLEAYAGFIAENFPDTAGVFFTLAYPTGRCWQNKAMVQKATDAAPFFLKAWRRLERSRIRLFLPHCGMPGFPLCLLGRKYRKGLVGLISSERKNISSREFRCFNIKPPACRPCSYYDLCVGISLNYKKIYGTDEFVPVENNKYAL